MPEKTFAINLISRGLASYHREGVFTHVLRGCQGQAQLTSGEIATRPGTSWGSRKESRKGSPSWGAGSPAIGTTRRPDHAPRNSRDCTYL